MKSFEKETTRAQLKDEQKTLKELEKAYKQAKKDVQNNLKALNARPDMVDVETVIHQKQYQNALLKQIDGVLNDLQTHTYKTANDFFQGSYQNGYIGSFYEMMKQGIPMTIPIDPKLMVTAIQTDSKLSKKYYLGKGLTVQNIRTLKQKIASEVTRGIASGQTWLEVAESLQVQKAFSISQSDAIRIARTEGNRINQQARLDAGDISIQNGCDLLKMWDATLDSRTRPAHREADGQVVEWKDDFTVMGEKLKAPCIGGSAGNVCNCRCQLLKRPRWALDEDELEVLKERAKFYGLDKAESFEAYKEKFLKLPENIPTVPFKVLEDAIDFSKLSDEEFQKWEDAYIKFNQGVDLTDEELELIEDYTEGGFSLFNAVDRKTTEQLLNEGFTEEQIKRYKERSKQLSDIISKYNLQSDVVTHRFERDVSWLTGNGNGVEELEKLIGQDRSFQGFTSSSFAEMRTRFTGGKKDAVHFEILTPKGTNGAYLFQSKKGELEFLYNRNTRFRILDGGERKVKETFFNINTMKMDEREIVERFLKIQVYPTKTVANAQVEEVVKKVVLSTANFPSAFSATRSEKKNTQELVDFINSKDSVYDNNVVELFSNMSDMDFLTDSQRLKVSHGSKHAVGYSYRRSNGQYIDVKVTVPKLTGSISEIDTTLHEEMHFMDLLAGGDNGHDGWYSANDKNLIDTFKKTDASIGKEMQNLLDNFHAEYEKASKASEQLLHERLKELDSHPYKTNAGRAGWSYYPDYKKQRDKIWKECEAIRSEQCRSVLGGGYPALEDIYDALSKGRYQDTGVVKYGHGSRYYTRNSSSVVEESLANYSTLSIAHPELLEALKRDKPEVVKALEKCVKGMVKKVK